MLHLDCSVCKNENLLLLFNFGKKEVNKFMVLFFGIDRYVPKHSRWHLQFWKWNPKSIQWAYVNMSLYIIWQITKLLFKKKVPLNREFYEPVSYQMIYIYIYNIYIYIYIYIYAVYHHEAAIYKMFDLRHFQALKNDWLVGQSA